MNRSVFGSPLSAKVVAVVPLISQKHSKKRQAQRTEANPPAPHDRSVLPPSVLRARQRGLHSIFSALVKLFGEFTFILDLDGKILNSSFAGQIPAGRSARSLIGQDISALLGEKHNGLFENALSRALASRCKECAEHRVELPGGPRWFQSFLVPLDHLNGGPKKIGLFSKDVTARKEAHDRFRKNEALLLQAEELARLGSFQLDLQSYNVSWSKQLYRNLGLDPQHGITWPGFLSMVHPDDRDRLLQEMQNGIACNQILDSEFRCILGNGEVLTLHRRAIPFYDEAGNPLALVGMAQDVTERKQFEDHLRSREALLAQAEQLADLGSWEWNLETSQVTWSDHRYRLLGLDPETQPPSIDNFLNLVYPEDRERVRAEYENAIAQARPLEYEARFFHADGRIRTLHVRGVPVVNSGGRTIRLTGMAQDVTERRSEEDRLRRSEALLLQAEEIANVGCWEQEVKTSRMMLSQQLLRMYGIRSQEEWNEDRFWSRLLLPDANSVRAQCERAVKECEPFEFTARYRMPDGAIRVYRIVGKPIPGEDGSAERVLGVVHDITGHTRIEEELRRITQRLIRTRDSERRQLARELHESAGQSLAALKMTLGNLRETLPDESLAARDHLDAARGFAEDAIREVRVISYLMYPPLLDDAGLSPALNWYLRGFSERSGIKATLEIEDGFGRHSQEIESTVFSVVQEALTNVHRYSGSPTVIVRLDHNLGYVRAEIEDQGCGLPVLSTARGRSPAFGVGIPGMRERVKELNGSFEILSTPGCGTLVRAVLPVPAARAANSTADSA